ncbi:translation initiation factor 2 [Lysinibacillus fusiformis]|uniref:translation initiation factor 2 n=1 Tax=Lysinibacillus fusiformis TaxID=28031 RepID=UPI0011A54976|nr:translation initiation factor 2 [Lysinibacillus fusiformis]
MNENKKRFGQGDRNLALQAAELAVVGEVLSTLGDTISTFSAILALEAEVQEKDETENNNKYMQKQIDYLTTELEKLKNIVNKQYPYKK